MSEWQPIETAERPGEDTVPLIVLQSGRRFIAEWDGAAGHWQGIFAIDGVERDAFFQEWPGRLYGATHWATLPEPPQ
jgi:hypothetical protein